MTPDINVLVAASRSDHSHHAIARDWLEQALVECEAGGRLELLPVVVAGFLRLVTNRRVFPDPSPIKDAVALSMRLSPPRGWKSRKADVNGKRYVDCVLRGTVRQRHSRRLDSCDCPGA